LGWLEKKTGPPATEVSNAEDVKESGQVVAIGFFKERESDDTKRFLTVAEGQDVPKMLITSSDELFKEYEVKEGAIVMIKPFDESRLDYSGEATEAVIFQNHFFLLFSS
jgi:co-chaperonin GroES (HSP10)